MRHSRSVLWMCTFLILGLVPSRINSQQLPSDYNPNLPPVAEGAPTRVEIGLIIFDVSNIDEVHQEFIASVLYTIRWRDPRLADPDAPETRATDFNKIWWPQITISNRVNIDENMMPDIFRMDRDGNVFVMDRTLIVLTSSMDLHDFPYDKQQMSIDVLSYSYGLTSFNSLLMKRIRGGMKRFRYRVGMSLEI